MAVLSLCGEFGSVLYRNALWDSFVGHFRKMVACSRLRDGGAKSFSNKKCEKRAGAGAFPSRARLISALLVLTRSHYTI